MVFVEDDVVAYFAGTQLILYNVQTQTQRFIPVKEGNTVSNLCVSAPHALVALSVISEKTPMLVVYDLTTLKKRKVIQAPESATCKVRKSH